jgi:hypothetical protein
LRHVDLRVFGEIYAALWVLGESREAGPSARARLRQLCCGRAVHRRRYAARRAIATAADRMTRQGPPVEGTTATMCRIPPATEADSYLRSAEAIATVEARLFDLLAALWCASSAEVEREIRKRLSVGSSSPAAWETEGREVDVDRSLSRPIARRLRVDRRRGRPPNRRAA